MIEDVVSCTMIVYDIFERDGFPSPYTDRFYGTGEVWVATVSSKEVAVDHYCRDALNVVRPREGDASDCEDLD